MIWNLIGSIGGKVLDIVDDVVEDKDEANRLKFEIQRQLIENDIKKLIEAIKEGVPGSIIKDELQTLEDRRQELTYALEHAPVSLPRLHPNLAQIYHDKVARLTAALNEESNRAEAAEAIRALIEEVRLVPDDGNLRIELFGELAALINLTNEFPRSKETGVQVTLVAGAGFGPFYNSPKMVVNF